MSNTENYEQLKDTTKGFVQWVTSNNMYYLVFLFVVMIIAINMINLLFFPLKKTGKENITANFIKLCMKSLVVVILGFRMIELIPGMEDFTSQILMSSSLIVVVLGFVFQEGLSNIVHGVIISIFKPFNIGDRVHITIDGESITGYINAIDLRHTVITNVLNASRVIVPNAKMDTCVIDNYYFGKDLFSTNFMDISVTYDSDLEKALQVLEDVILSNPIVKQTRAEKGISGSLNPMVRELGESAICLRASVSTLTVEDNFRACSAIRRELVARFKADPDLDFAYPHVQIVQNDLTERVADKRKKKRALEKALEKEIPS